MKSTFYNTLLWLIMMSCPFLNLPAQTAVKSTEANMVVEISLQAGKVHADPFSDAIQIVCGPYPDEDMMEPRWENEAGMPYLTQDFSVVNPKYFEYSDRRMEHLIDAGMVPVIVGGWGRPQGGGKSTLMQVGLDGFKRHWRNLVARYGAYPAVWMVGGEVKDAFGPWSELARSVCNNMIHGADFYPTLLEMAHLPLRPGQHRDGVSLVPLLKGKKDFDRGPLVWHYPVSLPRHNSKPGSAIRSGDWKFIHYYEDGSQELYNLKNDIGESDNLSGRMPEKAAEMKARLDAMLNEHGAKIPSPDPQ